jgi:2-(1,2-epoxy-1,2-dihydrophenyl)acetyl-CoA isomerase
MSDGSDELLLTSPAPGVTVATLNRPDKLNALPDRLLRTLGHRLREAAARPGTRALVLTGAGRAFSAGGDLTDLHPRLAGAGVEAARQHMLAYHDTVLAIRAVPVPVVAAVNGVCAGAGVSLALACDLVVAGASVSFASSFTKVGLVPDLGSLYFWTRGMGAQRAKEWAFLGEPLTAEEAHRLGLVNRVVADGTALDEAISLAGRLAEGPPDAFAMVKSVVNSVEAGALAAVLDREAYAQAAAFQTGEVDEGVAAFQERRPARFAKEPRPTGAGAR